VHFGRAEAVLERRHNTRLGAYAAHPERFPHGQPKRQELAPATDINAPERGSAAGLAHIELATHRAAIDPEPAEATSASPPTRHRALAAEGAH